MPDIPALTAINAYKNTAGIAQNISNSGGEGVSFSGLVRETMNEAGSALSNAEAVSAKALLNEASLDDLAVSVTNAEMTLKTIVAVRDRVIAAYQDIMKMPI